MKKKKEPWKIVLAIISIIFIVFMWIKKDIVTIYSAMPKEQIVPLVLTTIIVTLVKVIGIVVTILLIKWIVVRTK